MDIQTDTQNTERVVVLLPKETKDALTQLAAKRSISVSATVRQLVAEELSRATLPSFTISA